MTRLLLKFSKSLIGTACRTGSPLVIAERCWPEIAEQAGVAVEVIR